MIKWISPAKDDWLINFHLNEKLQNTPENAKTRKSLTKIQNGKEKEKELEKCKEGKNIKKRNVCMKRLEYF